MPGACNFTGKYDIIHLLKVSYIGFPMWFQIPLLVAAGGGFLIIHLSVHNISYQEICHYLLFPLKHF